MQESTTSGLPSDTLPTESPGEPKPVVVFGEALWDLLPDGEVLGGAPLNFAYRMHCFGHRAQMVTALGLDERGGRARAVIRELGLDDAFVAQVVEAPTGTVDVHLQPDGGVDYTINPNVAYDFVEVTPHLIEAVSRADALCFGTLAQRRAVSRRTLRSITETVGDVPVVYDVNLRKECFTPGIVSDSIDCATVVKLNEDEVAPTGGMVGLPQDLHGFAEALVRERAPECCIVTLGERGVYVTVQGRGAAVYVPGFHVEVTDPLGAGDAFTAGFVSATLEGRSLRAACLWGNAAGALVASQRGATLAFTREDVRTFLESRLEATGQRSGRVKWKDVNIDPRFEDGDVLGLGDERGNTTGGVA